MGKQITPEDVLPILLETAKMICAEQPDMPEPESLKDLDSFSFVQVILEMENIGKFQILEKLEDFEGETFEDLAEFIAGCEPEDYDVAEAAQTQVPNTGAEAETPKIESVPAD